MVDVNNSSSNNSTVIGTNTGAALSQTNNGLSSMSGAIAGSSGATNGGMTSEIMNAQTGTSSSGPTGDRLDASSDSAVSSMGSERVPSLSDGEWGEGSDSAQDYHHGKYGGPYDYSYPNSNNAHNRLNVDGGNRQPMVAQKKHQMYGKRFFNENNVTPAPPASIKFEYDPYPMSVPGMHGTNLATGGAMHNINNAEPTIKEHQNSYDLKYGGFGGMGVPPYSLDFSVRQPRNAHEIVQHNHTYHLPQGTGSLPRPQLRDKKIPQGGGKSGKLSNNNNEDEHYTRDEKRARALNIPITVNEIINLPMDEFNERLSKYDLTENQLSLIRDIRRRGKNKVAAQNCRKRKLDQIISLEDEVKQVRQRKEQLIQEHDDLSTERKHISNKFASLHRHIFQYLRDSDGNPCSPSDFSLHLAADGSVYLLPRDSSNITDAIVPITDHSRNVVTSTQQQQTQQQQQQTSQQHHLQTHHQHMPQHGIALQQQQQQQQQQQSPQQSQQPSSQQRHHSNPKD